LVVFGKVDILAVKKLVLNKTNINSLEYKSPL